MGGDLAPAAAVAGAYEAVAVPGTSFDVLLVGDAQLIGEEQKKFSPSPRIGVRHASEVIGMHESPTVALRAKKDSSILRSVELHREGVVQGFVSAGNTGAVMAASTLTLGRIENVSRPTIGTFIPNTESLTLLVDAGANVDCKPRHLLEFGVMGSEFVTCILGKEKPRVGLLNIGEEESKGNETALAAHELLRGADLNFVGNVEGQDVLLGTVDVAVCDGFVGNIILKFAEGVIGLLKAKFRTYAAAGIARKLRMATIAGPMRTIMRDMDYQEHGGVPLLGVNGVTIIGHGKSTPKAIRNMILRADEMIARRINERIARAMEGVR